MKRFCVIGLGQFGYQVALTLAQMGSEVLVLDLDESRVARIKDEVGLALRLDATDREALRAAGVDDVATAVVALGEDFEAAVLVTSHLKHLGIGWIVARASSEVQGEILSLIGANKVVYPEVQMAEQLARGLHSSNILEHLRIGDDLNVVELRAPVSFEGQCLKDLGLRQRFDVNVVAVHRMKPYVVEEGTVEHRRSSILMSPTEPIAHDDILVVVGSDASVEKLLKVDRE